MSQTILIVILASLTAPSTSGWATTVLALMHEIITPNSFWRPYLDLVPNYDEMDLPMFWKMSVSFLHTISIQFEE